MIFLRAIIIWLNVGHSCERLLITVENICHVVTAWINALLTLFYTKKRLINNQQFLSNQLLSTTLTHTTLLTKSPSEMLGTPRDISKLISSVSFSPDQGSNYFAAQMISAHIFYASEPGSHRYMSSIITLKLQQPWLLSMMFVSSSLMIHQYCIDFSFSFNLFNTITVVQRCPFSKVDLREKDWIVSIPCSWIEAFQPLCSEHSYMSRLTSTTEIYPYRMWG